MMPRRLKMQFISFWLAPHCCTVQYNPSDWTPHWGHLKSFRPSVRGNIILGLKMTRNVLYKQCERWLQHCPDAHVPSLWHPVWLSSSQEINCRGTTSLPFAAQRRCRCLNSGFSAQRVYSSVRIEEMRWLLVRLQQWLNIPGQVFF